MGSWSPRRRKPRPTPGALADRGLGWFPGVLGYLGPTAPLSHAPALPFTSLAILTFAVGSSTVVQAGREDGDSGLGCSCECSWGVGRIRSRDSESSALTSPQNPHTQKFPHPGSQPPPRRWCLFASRPERMGSEVEPGFRRSSGVAGKQVHRQPGFEPSLTSCGVLDKSLNLSVAPFLCP